MFCFGFFNGQSPNEWSNSSAGRIDFRPFWSIRFPKWFDFDHSAQNQNRSLGQFDAKNQHEFDHLTQIANRPFGQFDVKNQHAFDHFAQIANRPFGRFDVKNQHPFDRINQFLKIAFGQNSFISLTSLTKLMILDNCETYAKPIGKRIEIMLERSIDAKNKEIGMVNLVNSR